MQEQICFYSQHFAIPICLVGNVDIPKSHPSCFFYENITRYYFPFYTLVQLHVCLHFANWLCSQSDLKCSDFRVTWQTGSMITSLRWWLKPPYLVDQNITDNKKKSSHLSVPNSMSQFLKSLFHQTQVGPRSDCDMIGLVLWSNQTSWDFKAEICLSQWNLCLADVKLTIVILKLNLVE